MMSSMWTTIAVVALLAPTADAFSHYPYVPSRSFGTSRTSLTRVWSSSPPDEKVNDDNTATTTTNQNSNTFSQDVMDDANDALASVGWSRPMDDGEMTSEDPFVKSIDEGIQRDFGVSLDELLNPAKVVNLERDLYNLRSELASLTGVIVAEEEVDVGSLSTDECDGGGGGEEADAIRAKIAKKETSLAIERRSVFRGWLKNIFLGQAVFSFALSFVMATSPGVLFGGFDWYQYYQMETPIQVLGFWWWWLFIVPSLRSRRPSGPEKKALDIAFLGTPLISLIAPAATKDTGIIWAANLLVVAAAYGYAFAFASEDDDDSNNSGKNQPEWLKFVYKSLDFGVGKERGARQ
mmetsp:Transcript_16972/g.26292  ORF Transcript_16972/g.26292 Transcript_16972/m.26292 type:complete len:350 (-) Transcript_16972:152-1201(-)